MMGEGTDDGLAVTTGAEPRHAIYGSSCGLPGQTLSFVSMMKIKIKGNSQIGVDFIASLTTCLYIESLPLVSHQTAALE